MKYLIFIETKNHESLSLLSYSLPLNNRQEHPQG